jgi:aspartate racemase
MRTIGLLGGMSWVSTTHYYEGLNSQIAARLGGSHCAAVVLWQSDFAEITALQEAGRWTEAGELLAEGTRRLVAAGAEVIAICANTMHLVADSVIAAADPVPLVSIIDAVRQRCLELGVSRLGLVGTAYTMESSRLFPEPLSRSGIEVLVPTQPLRDDIQRHTFDELILNVVTHEARSTFRQAIAQLVDRGAQAVVLACTEHAMAVAPEEFSIPVLDSTQLHIDALVHAALVL